jgi:ABC-2 type transport system permease protein
MPLGIALKTAYLAPFFPVLRYILLVNTAEKSPKMPMYRGVSASASYSTQLVAAVDDLWRGFQLPQVWALGAFRAVGNSYKKTVLGPWWITFSSCFFVFGLSYLRVALGGSGRSWGEAVSFVGTGFLAFTFLSGAVSNSQSIFSSSQGINASSTVPISTTIFRSIAVNLLDFVHEAFVLVFLVVVFGIRPSLRWIELIPAIFAVVLFHLGLILWLGPLVCRFRDIGPIISMIQRIAIFLSPVFYSLDQVKTTGRVQLAHYNPYSYFITAFRNPILNQNTQLNMNPLLTALFIGFANVFVGLLVFAYSRPRLSFWATQP